MTGRSRRARFADPRWARLAGAIALLLTPAPVRAANDLCGQTIAQSITLTDDQTCGGGGLTLGADGITIDLGGFTLSGDGGVGEIGIQIAGHGQIVITNGTIRGFYDGIVTTVAPTPVGLKLSGVTVRENVRKGAALSSTPSR